jgi:hypothetical protein
MIMREIQKQAIAMREPPMNSSILRQLWSVVEETQANILLSFGDTELVQQLVEQVESRGLLNTEEVGTVSAYLNSRLLLIRDMARARLA